MIGNDVRTKPATIRPPVPWDVTDATAIRLAKDQSSGLGVKFVAFEINLIESMLSAGDAILCGICKEQKEITIAPL